MSLTYEEVEEHLEYITTGVKLVDVSGLSLLFRNPETKIRMKARRIYKLEYDKSIQDGMVSNEQMRELLEQRNIVTDDDRAKLKKIESQLEAQRKVLSMTTRVRARQDRVKEIIKDLENQKNKIIAKERSKYSMTAETRAEESRILYMCWACTYDEEDNLYWSTYTDFVNEKDYILRQSVLSEFITFYSGIPTSTIRAMARSSIWRIKYVTSMKITEELFGVPVADYSSDMLNLVYWSHYYQNINEMLPEDQPPDDLMEDDAALDAFMEEYHKERSQEVADRKHRKGNKGKLSAFDKDEVIVTKVANELYDDIDFDEPKEAARIKDKPMIQKKTRRR